MRLIDVDANEPYLLDGKYKVDAPQYGRWVEDYNNTYRRCRMKCSACGQFSGIGGIKSNQKKPFCPNCGARMK